MSEYVKNGVRDYEELQPENRKQVFETVEHRWAFAFNQAQHALQEATEAEVEIATLERENADVLPRGGRSRSEAVQQIEALHRLEMPEEVDGRKLSNEPAREAWLTGVLADDPNYQAARERQAEVEERVTELRQVVEQRKAAIELLHAQMQHMNAVLGFFSVPPSGKKP